MPKCKIIAGISFVLLVWGSITFAQNVKQIERTVIQYSHRIDEAEAKHNGDSLREINESLLNYLQGNLPKAPESLSATYESMGTRIHSALSPDLKLRIWSWNNGQRGVKNNSPHSYSALAEFRTSYGISTQILILEDSDEDYGRFTRGICNSIDTIPIYDIDKKSIVYFLYFSSPEDSGYCNEDVQAFKIMGDKLEIDNVFSDIFGDGSQSNAIHISYFCSSRGLLDLFWMSPNKTAFTVAVTDTNDRVTALAADYSRDGDKFYKHGFSFHPKPGKTLSDVEEIFSQVNNDIGRFKDSSYSDLKYDDSLENVNSWLSGYLKVTLPSIPETLTDTVTSPSFLFASYRDLRVHQIPMVTIASSEDHKIRIWSWNTWTGGSWIAYENLVEYQTNDGIKVIDLEKDLRWGPKDRGDNCIFDTIYEVKGISGITYYMARGVYTADGRNSGSVLLAFAINGTELNTEPTIFFNNETEYDRQKGPQYEISSGCEDCPVPYIKMNSDGTKLYIQHIGINKKNREVVTKRWDVFMFDGEHYIYKGIK